LIERLGGSFLDELFHKGILFFRIRNTKCGDGDEYGWLGRQRRKAVAESLSRNPLAGKPLPSSAPNPERPAVGCDGNVRPYNRTGHSDAH